MASKSPKTDAGRRRGLTVPEATALKKCPRTRGAGAKDNGSMTKHVSDTSAARNNGGWFPLSEKFAPKGIPPVHPGETPPVEGGVRIFTGAGQAGGVRS